MVNALRIIKNVNDMKKLAEDCFSISEDWLKKACEGEEFNQGNLFEVFFNKKNQEILRCEIKKYKHFKGSFGSSLLDEYMSTQRVKEKLIQKIKKEGLKIKFGSSLYLFLKPLINTDTILFKEIKVKATRSGMKGGVNAGLNWYNHLSLKINGIDKEYQETITEDDINLGDIIEIKGEGEKEKGFDGSSYFYDLHEIYQAIELNHPILFGKAFKLVPSSYSV